MTVREQDHRQRGMAGRGRNEDGYVLNVAPFLSLARDVSTLLVPMRPRPAYRAQLEQSLLAAARRQAARYTLDIEFPSVELTQTYRELAASAMQPMVDKMDRRWLMGAAVGVGSAFSLAGLMAYVWRQRRRHAA